MARLIAKSPLGEVLPVETAGGMLSEVDLGAVTSVAPFRGKERTASLALRTIGLGFPAPGKVIARDGARILWSGRGQALLLGAGPPEALAAVAALTDQSDAFAAIRLDGPLAEAALARLVPLDLRAATFRRGQTARTMLFHMTCQITRLGAESFEILAMRSMGRTAVHDLTVALKSVAAQA